MLTFFIDTKSHGLCEYHFPKCKVLSKKENTFINQLFDHRRGKGIQLNPCISSIFIPFFSIMDFISEKQQAEMWSAQTIMPNKPVAPYFSHFKSYGLGWQLSEVKGNFQVSHTGGLDGIVTQVTLLPELNLGIIVLTNQQNGAAFNAITNSIKDSYLNLKSDDYVTLYSSQRKEKVVSADKITDEVWSTVAQNKKDKINVDTKKYVGTYKDNWLGEIMLYELKGKMYFRSTRSVQLTGEVFFYKDQTFAVKWNNRSLLADALLTFSADSTNIKMRPISPLTDFSYDFQDLDFTKVK